MRYRHDRNSVGCVHTGASHHHKNPASLPSSFNTQAGGAISARFSGGDEVLDWIEASLVAPVWQDPVCGDAACEAPHEFAAFGRFGCK